MQLYFLPPVYNYSLILTLLFHIILYGFGRIIIDNILGYDKATTWKFSAIIWCMLKT